MLRGLSYYWRQNLAVILSCAVATAVLTGALIVGDSVRGSLHDLTVERLGLIDYALQSPIFVRAELGPLLEAELGDAGERASAAIILAGGARHAVSGARASGVGIQGVDSDFVALYPGAPLDLAARPSGAPKVVVNQALQRELGAEIGDSLLLSLARPGQAPRETLLGSGETGDVVRELRLTLSGVLPDTGLGRFSLQPDQSLPLVAFVDLETLQAALDQPGRVNALLLQLSSGQSDPADAVDLEAGLQKVLALEDLGLELSEGVGFVGLESRDHIFSPPLAEEVIAFAARIGAPSFRISTYIANELQVGGTTVPYSAITAFDTAVAAPFGPLSLIDGGAAPALAAYEVLINEWLAEDLQAGAGDELAMTYFEVGPKEELITRSRSFRVRGVVALAGLWADRRLTPDFPGIHDADNMADWEPPFPVDLERIRTRDEEYWDLYGATPKVFFAEATGAELWATRFGRFTGIRLSPASEEVALGSEGVSALAESVRRGLPSGVEPSRLGLRFESVRERGLAAASGATDFRGLFLGFSMFLIVSAALLVSLFFTLGVERRAQEVGLLLAMGFALKSVRRRFLAEGATLALVGVLAGSVGAVFYGAAMMAALRSLWRAAVGTPYLSLHVESLSLIVGGVIAFLVILLSISLSLRRLAKLSLIGLLRGVTRAPRGARESGSRARWVFVVATVAGVGLVATGVAFGEGSSPALFFGAGSCLLVAGLAVFSLQLARPRRILRPDHQAYLSMAARNAAASPGRSLLSAALVSSAAFVIVAVAANGFRYGEEVGELSSAAGGYTLVAEAAIPLHQDLTAADAGFELGLSAATRDLLASTAVTAFRLLPGDDVSCLNLYQPESPRILGVPEAQIDRGGFRFQQLIEESEDPWSLLTAETAEVVPAFGDFESMTWILKLGLGEELIVENDRGEPVRIRLVGLLEKSLFQSEMLISEENFKRHFPSRTGHSYFLMDPPAGREDELAGLLEGSLSAYGFDVTPTAEKLQRYQAVFNTYLATFQTLGGLGLLLGTVGLAAVLLRNVLERRGELATLRALGFHRRGLAWLVVAENAVLLVFGVLIGSLAALLAVSPHLVAGNALVPWGSLLLTLLVIVALGLLASSAAVRQALAAPLLPALKGD